MEATWRDDPWAATPPTGARRLATILTTCSVRTGIVGRRRFVGSRSSLPGRARRRRLLVAGGVGLWYLRQVNPPASPGAAVNFTVDQTATRSQRSATACRRQGFINDAGVFAGTSSTRVASSSRPATTSCARRTHGQHRVGAAHAAGADLHQGDVPRGLHGRRRWPSASPSEITTMTAADFARR